MKKSSTPLVECQMMIRKPVATVFQAFIDPTVTTKFWFTKSSGKLEVGKTVKWEWEMYNVSSDVARLNRYSGIKQALTAN